MDREEVESRSINTQEKKKKRNSERDQYPVMETKQAWSMRIYYVEKEHHFLTEQSG